MTTGRPGAAHICLPYDLQKHEADAADVWAQPGHDHFPTQRYAADATPQSIDYCAVDWSAPSTLIIGNEARGLSPAARTLANQLVMIPMRAGIESLNAAMAASVILFESQRQRRTQG